MASKTNPLREMNDPASVPLFIFALLCRSSLSAALMTQYSFYALSDRLSAESLKMISERNTFSLDPDAHQEISFSENAFYAMTFSSETMFSRVAEGFENYLKIMADYVLKSDPNALINMQAAKKSTIDSNPEAYIPFSFVASHSHLSMEDFLLQLKDRHLKLISSKKFAHEKLIDQIEKALGFKIFNASERKLMRIVFEVRNMLTHEHSQDESGKMQELRILLGSSQEGKHTTAQDAQSLANKLFEFANYVDAAIKHSFPSEKVFSCPAVVLHIEFSMPAKLVEVLFSDHSITPKT